MLSSFLHGLEVLFPRFLPSAAGTSHWPLKQNRKATTKIMQTWAKSFYKSKAWLKCRNAYIRKRVAIDGGICEECHDNQGYIVHHKTMLTKDNVNDPEVTLDEKNLFFVCKSCHDEYDGHGVRHGHGLGLLVEFDADGMPVRSLSRARTCM